jgi:cytoplasmic iron level regulating protein YaaA (DUF328/UPF0246 family)
MLIILSPAKTLDFKTPSVTDIFSIPTHISESEKIADKLRKLPSDKLRSLMNISPKLAQLNFERYQLWQTEFSSKMAKQALLAFRGEVYTGINADTLSENEFVVAQKHLRILCGLHGVLRPLDLVRPYRLEMGTKISVAGKKNLYEFWKNIIYKEIQTALDESGSNLLINLASNEYYKAIDKKKLKADIVTPVFKDWKNGQYKMITIWAKRARGLMTRFIIKNRITDKEDLIAFESNGYHFNPRLSTVNKPVFTREH